jgi:hypothetical protein
LVGIAMPPKADNPRLDPQLPWRSTGCCAHPPPTELSAPASNRIGERQHASSTLRSFLERWTSLASGIIHILNRLTIQEKSVLARGVKVNCVRGADVQSRARFEKNATCSGSGAVNFLSL